MALNARYFPVNGGRLFCFSVRFSLYNPGSKVICSLLEMILHSCCISDGDLITRLQLQTERLDLTSCGT